jgi:predicted small lipoprotein YifL
MRAIAITAVLAALALGGCGQAGRLSGPEAKLPSDEESPGFLDRLSSQKTVSENDAMRGVLMLVRGKDEQATFADRVSQMRELKLVDAAWDFDANRPVTRGKLAYMLYQGLHMQGGVVLALTGPSQRYCARELHYQGIMASDIMTTKVSGGEFVAVIGRADAYKSKGEVPDILKTPAGG